MAADGGTEGRADTYGHCDPRFSRVREVFDAHFADGEELGASFAVFLDGEPVVELWGGVANRRSGRAWERDTPVLAYSCTKAVTATAAQLLAERGLLDVTAPVADVWPEFARRGKERVTVEHLLTHQAGLPALEEPVPVEEFEDQAAIADRLAGQEPIWEPGTAHGYHALTYGFLVGEVVRRVSGKSVGEIVATEISGPLGLELWVGAPGRRGGAGGPAVRRGPPRGTRGTHGIHGIHGTQCPHGGRAAGTGAGRPCLRDGQGLSRQGQPVEPGTGQPSDPQVAWRSQPPGRPARGLARDGRRHHRAGPGGLLP
ncbi:hypothetical protein GCM10018952_55550 [Streptosporangium vulgare]